MIHFVLDDLRCPAGVGLDAGLQFQGLIFDLDGFIAFTRPQTAEKRQTTFLGIVCTILFYDLGIEHYRVRRSSSTLIKKCNDALAHPNHIRRHSNTAIFMRHKRIHQVLSNLQIFF